MNFNVLFRTCFHNHNKFLLKKQYFSKKAFFIKIKKINVWIRKLAYLFKSILFFSFVVQIIIFVFCKFHNHNKFLLKKQYFSKKAFFIKIKKINVWIRKLAYLFKSILFFSFVVQIIIFVFCKYYFYCCCFLFNELELKNNFDEKSTHPP